MLHDPLDIVMQVTLVHEIVVGVQRGRAELSSSSHYTPASPIFAFRHIRGV